MSNTMNIEVKATFTVDKTTFNTCMNLITLYARSHNIKGFLIDASLPEEECVYSEIETLEGIEECFGIIDKTNSENKEED